MTDAIKALLSSKRAIAAIVAVLGVVLSPLFGPVGYEVDLPKLALYVGSIATYILTQGMADHGKEAARINMESVASMDAAQWTPEPGVKS